MTDGRHDNALIHKRGANPLVLAVLNVLPLGIPIGYFRLGQRSKAVAGWIAVWILMPVGGLGVILSLILAYDAYRLGQKLAAGQAIGVRECEVDFLSRLPGFGWHRNQRPR